MTMTDPIADYLTRIRNALHARKSLVDIPASKVKKEITRILKRQRFIEDYIIIDDGKSGLIRILLKYTPQGKSVIEGLKRISRPGLRNYVGKGEIPRVQNNIGLAIITTSKGIITGTRAKKLGVGGEVLCYIW
ncbi:30S ribosomal protein S8 [candidate division LCP-89 bacterium B3_LCP]|uniref:Small ribosomal subunit protein uS8 n=1 Tax=candidate division LCP-89 bacterium B3_LCP TaxID=2012998 RepID=A0A532UZM4_UNCL8|nr:MAG: 30S ribosomal protein S8 [candidate division LCP-89 bacterium B3_LCP]